MLKSIYHYVLTSLDVGLAWASHLRSVSETLVRAGTSLKTGLPGGFRLRALVLFKMGPVRCSEEAQMVGGSALSALESPQPKRYR